MLPTKNRSSFFRHRTRTHLAHLRLCNSLLRCSLPSLKFKLWPQLTRATEPIQRLGQEFQIAPFCRDPYRFGHCQRNRARCRNLPHDSRPLVPHKRPVRLRPYAAIHHRKSARADELDVAAIPDQGAASCIFLEFSGHFFSVFVFCPIYLIQLPNDIS